MFDRYNMWNHQPVMNVDHAEFGHVRSLTACQLLGCQQWMNRNEYFESPTSQGSYWDSYLGPYALQKKTAMRNLSFLWNSEVFTNEFSSVPQFYGSSFLWVSFNPNPSSLGIPYNFEPYPIVANYIKVCTLFSFKNFPRASAFTGHACKRVGNGVEPIDMVPQLVEWMLTGTTGYPTNTMFGRCFILLCGNPMYMDVRSCQLAR